MKTVPAREAASDGFPGHQAIGLEVGNVFPVYGLEIAHFPHIAE
jgi:hypothetical protein